MKNLIIYILFFAFCPYLVQAQLNTAISIGTPYEGASNANKVYFLDKNEILSVTINTWDKVLLFQKMNVNTLELTSSIEDKELLKKYKYGGILQLQNNKIFLLYTSTIKKTDEEQLYYQELDFKTGKLSQIEKILIPYTKLKYSGFNYLVSHDKSKVLITSYLKSTNENDPNENIHGFYVFDQDLNLIWKKDVKMPFNHPSWINDYKIDNNGKIHLLCFISESMTNQYDVLVTIKDHQSPLESFRIKSQEKSRNRLYNGPLNKIYLLSSQDNTKISYGEIIGSEITSMTTIEPIKNAPPSGNRFPNFKPNQDGTILLIIYDYKIQNSLIHSGGKTVVGENSYYSNDIVVSKVAPNGKIIWTKTIHKKQEGAGMSEPNELGCGYFTDSNSHYFTYLDNTENFSLSDQEEFKTYKPEKGGTMALIKINDETGEITKKELLSTKDVNGIKLKTIDPGLFINLKSENTFIIEASPKKDELVLIKVKY